MARLFAFIYILVGMIIFSLAAACRGRLVVGAVDVLFSTPVRGVVRLHGVDVARRGLGHRECSLVEFSRLLAPGRPRFRASSDANLSALAAR